MQVLLNVFFCMFKHNKCQTILKALSCNHLCLCNLTLRCCLKDCYSNPTPKKSILYILKIFHIFLSHSDTLSEVFKPETLLFWHSQVLLQRTRATKHRGTQRCPSLCQTYLLSSCLGTSVQSTKWDNLLC